MVKVKLIVQALLYMGNRKAETEGYASGEKYWSLANEITDLFDIHELKEENEQTEADNGGQLKVKDILISIARLDEIMETKEILNLPVYIGDDDELNGIHCAWYGQPINPNNEDDEYIVELINERSGNIEIKGNAFLIS